MMIMTVNKGAEFHFEDCKAALRESILGDIYFSDNKITESFLKEGIKKGEIYVALDEKAKCMGFMRIEPDFAFSGFPLLRTVSVKPEYRGNGIGGSLLNFYESRACVNSTKLFLFVSELNERARKLYLEKGYVQVGSIPDFYAVGINELLFMKQK